MNMRAGKIKMMGWMAGVVAIGLLAMGGPSYAITAGQQKLLAKRAAQVDAYRKLTETIMGLQISSNTYVRDFVAESDEIRTGFDHFIKGLKIIGEPRYFDDGTCEVDVQVTLEQVMVALETLITTGPFGDKYVIRDMVTYNRKKIFTATGTGVPREEPEIAPEPQALPARTPTAGIPGWEDVTPRGRLMAERAAKVDGYRNLAETVNGLRISSNTYVRDFVAESDEIRTSLNTFLQGARQVGPTRYLPDGIAEVEVQITIQEVIKHLQTLQQRWVTEGRYFRVTEFRNTTFETIVGYYPKKVISAVGNGTVPEKYMTHSPTPHHSSMPVDVTPGWASQVVQATGTGVPREGQSGAEARLMAERAAKVEAMRNLVEKVYGVQIDSRTTVRDFVAEDDSISARVKQTLAGAEQVGEPRYLPDGSVEVTVQIAMDQIYVIYREYQTR